MKFLLDEDYPNIYPCLDCKYWRYLNGGAKYEGRPIPAGSFRFPACHYNIDEDELRGCAGGKECKRFAKYVDD